MLFSSLVFLWYFLPAVFFLYFITKNLHIRNGVLLAASLFFYAWGEPKYVILMLVSIGLNYFFGLWIGKMQSKHRMRLAVTTCVFLNLLLLGYFKYFNFAVEIANSLLSRFAGGAHTLSFREIARRSEFPSTRFRRFPTWWMCTGAKIRHRKIRST